MPAPGSSPPPRLQTPFQVLPAIDLLGGRVVRLEQGKFSRQTTFSDDPRSVGQNFVDGGATWLHVVDLDGARTGSPSHAGAIEAILAATAGSSASVEVAGGLRTVEACASVLAAGAARVVVGTRALADPAFAGQLVVAYGPERVAVALDIREGRAVGHGWAGGSEGVEVEQALRSLLNVGVTWFEVTAIDRDGMLGGPDLALLERLLHDPRARIVASAGIASVADLRAVRDLGCAGAIVGRALYDGTLDLATALRELSSKEGTAPHEGTAPQRR